MKLETEFRLLLQQQQLEARLHALLAPQYQSGMWVRLLHPPSDFSADEALLLCQCSASEWVAWVPEFGELRLDVDTIAPCD